MSSRANIYSVKQVNTYLKRMLDEDSILRNISVKGEISNCKYHYSGHIYFSLKDDSGVIRCVMFASNAKSLSFRMKDGMQVVVNGTVSVYERDGSYQLYARRIEQQGIGDLYAKFEELKTRLEDMGMFAPEYKRPISPFASNIGIVTSKTGAVIRDIYNVASRRNPYCSLYLYPAQVQGEGAAQTICKGIETLDKLGLDVIIIGRGGGSIEDLWCFNDETLARTIFNCSTPVISAVGHETDFTISDFVADHRAPTPSAAAEIAVFDLERFYQDLNNYKYGFEKIMSDRLSLYKDKTRSFQRLIESLSPQGRMNEYSSRLKVYKDRISEYMSLSLRDSVNRAQMLRIDLDDSMEQSLGKNKQRLGLLSAELNGMSPLKRLSEGYAYVDISGKGMLKSVNDVNENDTINITVSDGTINAVVTDKNTDSIFEIL